MWWRDVTSVRRFIDAPQNAVKSKLNTYPLAAT